MPEPSSVVTKSAATTRAAVAVVERRGSRTGARSAAPTRSATGDRADDLGVVAEHVGDARRGQHEVAPALGVAHAHVVDVGADRGARRSRRASTAWSSTRAGRSRASTTGKRT